MSYTQARQARRQAWATRLRPPADLLQMLTYRRPAGGRGEAAFIGRFLTPLSLSQDDAGNLYKRIGKAPVLWSCHTDSVHHEDGRQNIRIDGGKIKLARRELSNCLGADDAAGVWLCSELIKAGTEGLYVFHRGEEIGGIGSTYIATETPALLDGIQCAIALDRKGTDSVITHQGPRCSSDAFAVALGDSLGMRPDSFGLFTDTANYTELVPECTNLSVGYEGAHTSGETLDPAFLLSLRRRLIGLDTSTLPITRDPSVVERKSYGSYRGFEGMGTLTPIARFADGYARMLRMIQQFPGAVADFLAAHGYDAEDLDKWL